MIARLGKCSQSMVVKELVAHVLWNAAMVEVLLLVHVVSLLLHEMRMKKVRKWHSNRPHRAVFRNALMIKWSAELLRIAKINSILTRLCGRLTVAQGGRCFEAATRLSTAAA